MLADQVGLDCFGVGEHHRPDFAISAPEVVLAAIAGADHADRLGSAVTVLSTDDPVRVFQRFSTLNAISNGRAEVILGRGSFTESYPLFGYDLAHYEKLFEEKLAAVRGAAEGRAGDLERVDAAALKESDRLSADRKGTLRTWVGVGGSPESVVRAARYGLPLTLAIIGGSPMRFRPYVDLYQQRSQNSASRCSRSPCIRRATSPRPTTQAREELWPHYEAMMTRIGARARLAADDARAFEREAGPDGALCVGSPETVAAKIVGTVKRARAVALQPEIQQRHPAARQDDDEHRLIGTQVAPRVREALA